MDSYDVVGVLGRGAFGQVCLYLLLPNTYVFFNISQFMFVYRVVELVRDFNLKKLVVMKTIYIKSMSTDNVKVSL